MKTEDLVHMLATGSGAVDMSSARRRLRLALGLGVLGAAALMWSVLGIRSDITHGAMQDPMFWVKLAFAGLSASAAVAAVARLSRPGARLSGLAVALAVPVLGIWLLSAHALITAQPGERAELVFGETWLVCPLGIALLSVPVFAAVLWAMKGLAPTHLKLAGAGAGLASGTLGAVLYTLHCPEVTAPFIGIWYVLGMLIPAAVGALVGPRILRW